MRGRAGSVVWVGLVSGMIGLAPAMAEEHGGQEHAGQEHGGATTAAPAAGAEPAAAPAVAPTTEQIRQSIQQYVDDVTQDEGAFYVDDEVTGDTRELTLERVHERVGKTEDYYYSCADMRDAKSGELIDVDFDVEAYDDELEVVDVRVHKVNGKERYTYDEHDNRLPLETEPASTD